MFISADNRHNCARKMISILMVISFLVTFILSDALAAVDTESNFFAPGMSSENGKFASLNVDTLTIPSHLGEIRYSFRGDQDMVVIHVQDAHSNRFAQSKIADIIDYLNEEYGLTMVNLEGGAGDYDLSVFTGISGDEIRREVAEYFLDKGEVNGAEFYAINNPDKVKLWGVEDKDLYIANLRVYRNSLSYKKEVDGYLEELVHVFNNLKRHIYKPELLKIDMTYNAYKAGNIDFREYLEFLIGKAKQNAIDVKQFNNLYLVAQAMEKEDEVDFKKANTERGLLIDQIKNILSPKEMKELVEKTVGFKTKRISRKEFYNYLLRKARESALDIKDFPALSSYIVYVTLFEAVDRFEVMKELDELETEIKEPLYENDEQRELNFLSRNLSIMHNIFDFMLTKVDYAYYRDNIDTFSVGNFINFINTEAPKYKITARPSDSITKLDDYRNKIDKFYEYSFKRDDAFLDNMRFSPTSEGADAAIIMTGGFHTENLCELFQSNGISYVSIVPKFTSKKDYESPYFNLLSGQTTDVQQMLRSAIAQTQIAMLQVVNMLQEDTELKEVMFGKDAGDYFEMAVVIMSMLARNPNVNIRNLEITGVTVDSEGENIFVAINGVENPIELKVSDVLGEPGKEEVVAPAKIAPFTIRELGQTASDEVLTADISAMDNDELEEKARALEEEVFKDRKVSEDIAVDNLMIIGNMNFVVVPSTINGEEAVYNFSGSTRPIGIGVFAAVAEGVSSRGEHVVIKVLHAPSEEQIRGTASIEGEDPDEVFAEAQTEYNKRVLMLGREYMALQGLEGVEGVPEVLDAGSYVVDGVTYHYIVEEFAGGVSLDSLIRGRKLTQEQKLDIMDKFLDVLVEVYARGIINADLKPDNLLVDFNVDGSVKTVTLIDFGLALYTSDGSDVKISSRMGSPAYLSSSSIIAEGSEYTYGEKTHTHAAGYILHEMLYPGQELYDKPASIQAIDPETGDLSLDFIEWDNTHRGEVINRLKNSGSMTIDNRLRTLVGNMLSETDINDSAEALAWLETIRGNAVEAGLSQNERRAIFAMVAAEKGDMNKAADYLLSERKMPGVTAGAANSFQNIGANQELLGSVIAHAAARGEASEEALKEKFSAKALDGKNWVLGMIANGSSSEDVRKQEAQIRWGSLAGVATISMEGKPVKVEKLAAEEESVAEAKPAEILTVEESYKAAWDRLAGKFADSVGRINAVPIISEMRIFQKFVEGRGASTKDREQMSEEDKRNLITIMNEIGEQFKPNDYYYFKNLLGSERNIPQAGNTAQFLLFTIRQWHDTHAIQIIGEKDSVYNILDGTLGVVDDDLKGVILIKGLSSNPLLGQHAELINALSFVGTSAANYNYLAQGDNLLMGMVILDAVKNHGDLESDELAIKILENMQSVRGQASMEKWKSEDFIRESQRYVDRLKAPQVIGPPAMKGYEGDYVLERTRKMIEGEIDASGERGGKITYHNGLHFNELFDFFDRITVNLDLQDREAAERLVRMAIYVHDIGYFMADPSNPASIAPGHEDRSKEWIKSNWESLALDFLGALERDAVLYMVDKTKIRIGDDVRLEVEKDNSAYRTLDSINKGETLSPEELEGLSGYVAEHFPSANLNSEKDRNAVMDAIIGGKAVMVADIFGHAENYPELVLLLQPEFNIDDNPAKANTRFEQVSASTGFLKGFAVDMRLKYVLGLDSKGNPVEGFQDATLSLADKIPEDINVNRRINFEKMDIIAQVIDELKRGENVGENRDALRTFVAEGQAKGIISDNVRQELELEIASFAPEGDMSAPSNFMGKIDGEVIMGAVKVVDKGDNKLEVSGKDKNGEDRSTEITMAVHEEGRNEGEVIEGDAADIVETLNNLLGETNANSLTPEEERLIRTFENKLKEENVTRVVAIADSSDLFGFFDKGTLYLNRSLMDQDSLAFMGILHELLERGDLGLPQDYKGNAHTAARGVGTQGRNARGSFEREMGAEALDEIVLGENGLNRYIDLLESRMTRPLTNDEKALMEYNLDQIKKVNRPNPAKRSVSELVLFGIQDHLDYNANYEFTQRIKELKETIRRGGNDYHLVPGYNVYTRNIQAKLGRELAKDFRALGIGTVFGQFGEEPGDLTAKLRTMANFMLKDKFPQASVLCLTKAELAEAQAFLKELKASPKEETRDLANRFDIKYDNSYEGLDKNADQALIDVSKLMPISTKILDIKRKRDDFEFDAERLAFDNFLLLSFLSEDGFIEYIEDLNNMSTAELNERINELLVVGAVLRVTGVDWDEIQDYHESMEAVLKSL